MYETLVRIHKTLGRPAGFGLQKCHMTTSALQVYHVFVVPLVYPLNALFAWGFVATNTLMQEKHRTIIYRLTGIKSIGMTMDSSILFDLEELMKEVIRAHPYVRAYFGNRKSSPGYNFVFRRLFDLLGHAQFAADFPPLKSRKKRTETVRLWRRFCSYLNWPYINSDERHFGTCYATKIEEFNDGRTVEPGPEELLGLQLQPTQNAPTNADPDSDQLRGGSANLSDEQSNWWTDNTHLCELFCTFDSSHGGFDCGLDNGFDLGLWNPSV